MSDAAGAQTAQGFPMFYKKPEVLNAQAHANLGLKPGRSLAFASETHVVPVNVLEMPHAARHNPLVFTASDKPSPVIVVGLRAGQNVFVDKEGSWAADSYIPAYVRRYPFVFLRNEDQNRFTLCIDRASDQIGEGTDNPFFADGERTEMTAKALEFCTAYQREHLRTQAVCDLIGELELFKLQNGTFTLESGEKLALRDFNIIDEQKFNALDDEAFLKLRQGGALPTIYSHLISMQSWRELVRRASAAA
ncbi:MAG: SapC family protein [Alphaproteobacteria bacterium]